MNSFRQHIAGKAGRMIWLFDFLPKQKEIELRPQYIVEESVVPAISPPLPALILFLPKRKAPIALACCNRRRQWSAKSDDFAKAPLLLLLFPDRFSYLHSLQISIRQYGRVCVVPVPTLLGHQCTLIFHSTLHRHYRCRHLHLKEKRLTLISLRSF